jgi:hypothetical protein
MGLKRKIKRKANSLQPHTKIVDWGLRHLLEKIDRAITFLNRKSR